MNKSKNIDSSYDMIDQVTNHQINNLCTYLKCRFSTRNNYEIWFTVTHRL